MNYLKAFVLFFVFSFAILYNSNVWAQDSIYAKSVNKRIAQFENSSTLKRTGTSFCKFKDERVSGENCIDSLQSYNDPRDLHIYARKFFEGDSGVYVEERTYYYIDDYLVKVVYK